MTDRKPLLRLSRQAEAQRDPGSLVTQSAACNYQTAGSSKAGKQGGNNKEAHRPLACAYGRAIQASPPGISLSGWSSRFLPEKLTRQPESWLASERITCFSLLARPPARPPDHAEKLWQGWSHFRGQPATAMTLTTSIQPPVTCNTAALSIPSESESGSCCCLLDLRSSRHERGWILQLGKHHESLSSSTPSSPRAEAAGESAAVAVAPVV